MNKYYYKNPSFFTRRFFTRCIGSMLFIFGVLSFAYTFFPLVSWQLFFQPVFASQEVTAPIPKTLVMNNTTLGSLISNTNSLLQGTNYSNAQSWFPTVNIKDPSKPSIESYALSIPILNIKEARVSTIDYDLSKHLVNYPGTGIPGSNGTAVIFGHSSLPQWFAPDNYKTIFATAYKLQVGNELQITIQNAVYTYSIFSITVVDPTDTSMFAQNYDNSYVTLVTCTPPGTTWKRLIIKARLQKV